MRDAGAFVRPRPFRRVHYSADHSISTDTLPYIINYFLDLVYVYEYNLSMTRKGERAIELRDERRNSGFCIDCGLAATAGYSTCLNCRNLDTHRRSAIVALRRASGLCVCQQPLLLDGYVCETCWFRNKTQKATSLGRSRWKLLKDLLESQNYLCAYTGEKLVVGEQVATIDHKRPTSRGGDDSLENLHWITKRMNEMKGNFTHEEFLEACAKITERWPKKQNQLHIA